MLHYLVTIKYIRICFKSALIFKMTKNTNFNEIAVRIYLDNDINTILRETRESPLMFSQTWEDPMVEYNVIKNNDCKICLIGAAGDTFCTLAAINSARNFINSVDLIDVNPNQLYLCKLKCALLSHFNGTDIKSILMMGTMTDEITMDLLQDLLNKKLIDSETYEFWKENKQLLSKGVSRCGRFERLFKIANILGYKVFDEKTLINSFGESAVKYSTSSFVDFFANIRSKYFNTYSNFSQNYFYQQYVYNCYSECGDQPLYFLTKSFNINYPVQYVNLSIVDHLKNVPNNHYHLVSFSNLFDWMYQKEFHSAIEEICRTLTKGGVATFRRLNSDSNLMESLKTFAKYSDYNLSFEEDIFDKSHFYQEVIIMIKN